MGDIHSPAPVLLIIAASSRYAAALEWARTTAEARYGKLAFLSEPFDFSETAYYTATMGAELAKQFLAFTRLMDPAELPAVKRHTNQLESDYAAINQHAEPRPLNLDPGYITPAKLVLASTKDHAHRIYLHDGIYAEITLGYRKRSWQAMEWTYPDYRRDDYQQFFTQCREWLLNCEAAGHALK
jgi:hypothetical protein